MKRYVLAVVMLFCYVDLFAQLNLSNASRIKDIIYNVVDEYTGEIVSFIKVNDFYDGTKMQLSKCDNVIYIRYENNFYKRVYGEHINIKWFGCNENRSDNQLLINEVLRKYKSATIPIGTFPISGSIIIPEKAQLRGYGRNSIIKLKSTIPVDGIVVYRGAVVKDFNFYCTETALDLKAAILIIPWHNNSSRGEETILQNLFLIGDYPHLQGVGIKLQILKDNDQYSLIAFSKFLNINIYGFRDGIFCVLDYKGGNGISYINANIFNNITIYNCLRPIRLINSGKKEDVLAGKSTIMSNSFSDIIVQHVVGDYPAIYADGAVSNNFTTQIIDWSVSHLQETSKSSSNILNNLTPSKR